MAIVKSRRIVTLLLAEEDLDDIAVLDRVRLALGPKLAVLARLCHGPQRKQVLVLNHFRANEASGQVGVNGARGID